MTDQEFFEWLRMQQGPRISEQDFVSFEAIPRDGHFKTEDVTHIQIGNAIITGRLKTKALTASGEIVSAAALKLRCTTCGRFDSVGERCAICRHMVCVLCLRHVDPGTGEKPFCPEHARLARYLQNTWMLADRKDAKP